jgi:polar amino acid transport system substrate-binding protein
LAALPSNRSKLKRMMRSLILLCGILVSLNVCSVTEVIGRITVATELWEPSFVNKNGQGLYQLIIYRAYANNKVVFKYTSYDRSKYMVEHKQVDLWLGAYANEEDFAIYPKYPFDVDQVAVIYVTAKHQQFSIQKDLKGSVVAWILGYDYDRYFPELNMQKYEIADVQTALPMLTAGRVAFFINDLNETKDSISLEELSKLGLSIEVFALLPLYPAFINSQRGQKLADMWDKSIQQMKQDGTLQTLFKENGVEYLLEQIKQQ